MTIRRSGVRLFSLFNTRIWKESLRFPIVSRRTHSTAAPSWTVQLDSSPPFDPKMHWDSREEIGEGAADTEASGSGGEGENDDSQFNPTAPGETAPPHIPVLCREVMDSFWRLDSLAHHAPIFLDMTFGAGGHSAALLETFPDCTIYALDRDPIARQYATALQARYPGRLIPLTGKFSDLPVLLREQRVTTQFDGIILDAGCSSMQMDQAERGFAFSRPDAPLDMRMDGGGPGGSEVTAADVVNRMNEEDLAEIFKKYGDERHYKRIARAIVESRFMMKKFRTTGDLANCVMDVIGSDSRDRLSRKQHPATRVFQALRIFVNDELNELDYGLQIGHNLLRTKGIFVSITFHSKECKLVREHFHSADWRDRLLEDPKNPELSRLYRNQARFLPKDDVLDVMQFRWMLLNKKAIEPSEKETEFNPRSRSAKLRAALKISV
ncbi:putative methyltransferase-like protein 15-like protein [Hypsibius exemplaris]|uniref:Methyltransferase-like protein 15-like protein n=1 Tax=Hypsibius exemplaris TaxID=2072580 RepID=A0A1W0WNR2_HYPEX|nr:putative methyltransferase-like protein 15-like protein [Hypsibius exemplaris]